MENKTNKNSQSIFANLFVLFFLAFVIFSSLNSKSIERTTFVIEKGMSLNNLTNVFRRQKDIHVADAVLEIFRRRKNIENFNKKALYILIREMTGSNTQHITRIVNVMKKYHYRMFQEFHSTGEIDTANTGSIF